MFTKPKIYLLQIISLDRLGVNRSYVLNHIFYLDQIFNFYTAKTLRISSIRWKYVFSKLPVLRHLGGWAGSNSPPWQVAVLLPTFTCFLGQLKVTLVSSSTGSGGSTVTLSQLTDKQGAENTMIQYFRVAMYCNKLPRRYYASCRSFYYLARAGKCKYSIIVFIMVIFNQFNLIENNLCTIYLAIYLQLCHL